MSGKARSSSRTSWSSRTARLPSTTAVSAASARRSTTPVDVADPERENRRAQLKRRDFVAWNLKGSYVETCSCELMCPCNLSFDHGATYDFCRVTLVFNIREGDVDGTDIGGVKLALVGDTPKVMTEGNWKLGVFVDEQATDDQVEKLCRCLQRGARWPDG